MSCHTRDMTATNMQHARASHVSDCRRLRREQRVLLLLLLWLQPPVARGAKAPRVRRCVDSLCARLQRGT